MELTSEQLGQVLARIEPKLRLEFLRVVGILEKTDDLASLEFLLERGMVDEALRNLARAANRLGNAWAVAFTAGAEETSKFLNQIRSVVIDFDVTNARAVRTMQQNRLRLVSEFGQSQRAATREAIVEGIIRGDNPRAMARRFKNSIGLAPSQQRALENYRRALESGDRSALERALRDKRFDRTVARGGLSPEQIDKMVGRYRERLLSHRATVIARTEALRSVHEGNQEMFQQAVDAGELDQGQLVQVWHQTGDSRTRDSHRTMEGQERPLGTPFVSGAGNSLRYPGDPEAPPSESIQCRCRLGTVVREVAFTA